MQLFSISGWRISVHWSILNENQLNFSMPYIVLLFIDDDAKCFTYTWKPRGSYLLRICLNISVIMAIHFYRYFYCFHYSISIFSIDISIILIIYFNISIDIFIMSIISTDISIDISIIPPIFLFFLYIIPLFPSIFSFHPFIFILPISITLAIHFHQWLPPRLKLKNNGLYYYLNPWSL